MAQNALTVIAKIKPEELNALKKLLNDIGDNIRHNEYIHFTELSTTHFARWVILEKDGPYPDSLAFESNYDGSLDEYLKELVAKAGPGLDQIYSKCEGYPAEGTGDYKKFNEYIKAHAVPYGAFYIGYRGETVKSVQNAIELRKKIEEFLDREDIRPSLEKLSALQIREKIQQYLAQESTGRSEAATMSPERKGSVSAGRIMALALIALLAILCLPLLLPALLLWIIVLRIHERKDESIPHRPVFAEKELIRKEDIQVQNQLTHVVEIKPGLFRLVTLKIVLWAINQLAIYVFNKGALGGIPTIHFARWVFIDNNKRLLFFSNFDGSWDNYLGDFVDKASSGLTAVWSNTVGFPKTKFLAFDGARDVEPFKQWARDHQVHTQVWYSSCPHDTVRNILNDIQIRKGLGEPMDSQQAAQWLQRL